MAKARAKLSVEEAPQLIGKVADEYYEQELARLQVGAGQRAGVHPRAGPQGRRDLREQHAGKGGAIQRITQTLNPRAARIVALAAPTGGASGRRWYFQRYIVLSVPPSQARWSCSTAPGTTAQAWSGACGFCTQEDLRGVPAVLCRTPADTGAQRDITIVKYWFSVSDTEQEKRFRRG